MLYQDNPFKLLGVLPTDGRREIVRQAEEKSLLLDAQKCSDARTTLTNPQRRIGAEVHWFLDCSADEVKEIEDYISQELAGKTDSDFVWEKKSALTQMNIQLACIDAQNFGSLSSAKYYVLGISRLFESVNAEQVVYMINAARQKAGFPEVSKTQDIESAISELRSEIRQMISGKLQRLPKENYIQTITALSESYSGNRRYKGNAVLEDVISEYQLFINDTLHEQGQSIIKTANFIAMGAKKIDVNRAVTDLIERLYAWDELAQPLQLGALTKGSSHEESKEMLRALRDLALKLHNEYSYSEESLEITKAVQEVFKELPEFAELLDKDNKALSKIVEEKGVEDVISPLIDTIEEAFESLKTCHESLREEKRKELINCIKGANTQIKRECTDQETADSLRSAIGMLARSFSIELHNDLNRTEDALYIINAIEPLFSDLPELSETIKEDKKTLDSIWNEKKKTDAIVDGMKEIEALCNSIKQTTIGNKSGSIKTLLSKTEKLDKLIKSSIQDSDTRNKIRGNLAYTVRDVGIDMHNNHHDSDNAMTVLLALREEFSDLPDVWDVLKKDVSTLIDMRVANLQKGYQRTTATNSQQAASNQGSKGVGGAILALIVVIVIIIVAFNSNSSSTKTTPTSSSTPKPTTYSTPRPTATATPKPKPTLSLPAQTMPSNGEVLYCSSTDRPSTFTVRNGGNIFYYMKFVKAGTNTKVITFFVRPYCTAVIEMPSGNLELRYAYAPSGSAWYGEKHLFGDDTRYAKDEEYYDFSKYTWEISLDSTLASGSDMDVEYIDENEF